MRLLRLTLTACMAASTLGSFAADNRWVEVEGSENIQVFVDTQSLRRSETVVMAWTKYVYNKPQSVRNSNPPTTYLLDKSYGGYNCQNRTSVRLQTLRFSDLNGTVQVQSLSGPDDPTRYSAIVPDSIGESIINFICKR
jgi:hypothetical protein